MNPRAGAAVVAAALLAAPGCTFFVDDGVPPAPPRTIDEHTGSYGGVAFGASVADIRSAFGEPLPGDGYAPDGERFRGPEFIPTPEDRPSAKLKYEETAFLVAASVGMYSLMTTNEGDATRAGVAVGDPLARAKAAYENVRCGESVAGEPLFGDELPTYPWCRARVDDVDVFFGDDPIASITLSLVDRAAGRE